MAKDTKLVHFTVIDGTEEEIKEISKALGEMKSRLSLDIEFLVTNDRVQLHDVKFLLNELYALYKKEHKLKVQKNEKK